MAMVKARLTIRPDEPFEVDEAELPHLRNEGLLIEDEPAKTPAKVTPPKTEGA